MGFYIPLTLVRMGEKLVKIAGKLVKIGRKLVKVGGKIVKIGRKLGGNQGVNVVYRGKYQEYSPRKMARICTCRQIFYLLSPAVCVHHMDRHMGPRAGRWARYLTLLECNLVLPRGARSRLFNLPPMLAEHGDPTGAHLRRLPLRVPRPIPETYTILIRSRPKLYGSTFHYCTGVGWANTCVHKDAAS
jgi:hypothetical protein